MIRSVHYQLTVTLIAAISLALIYGGAIVIMDYSKHRDAVHAQMGDIATALGDTALEFISGYRAVLEAVSESDCIATHSQPACSTLFARLNRRFPNAVNFAAADADGNFFASGKPFPGNVAPNIAKAPFFVDLAKNGAEFHVMDPHKGPVSGKPVTGIAIPLKDESGRFAGLVGLSLDFDELLTRWQKISAPEDIIVMVLDRAGKQIHLSAGSQASEVPEVDGGFRNRLKSVSGVTELGGRQWFYWTRSIEHAAWTVVAMHPSPYGLREYLKDTPLLFQLLPPAIVLAVIGLWLAGRELRHLVGLEQAVEARTHELSLANERLAHSARELETLTWVASHDLREPSRSVAVYVSMLERRYGEQLDEDGRAFIGFARDGANRMNELVLALLDYLRIDRTKEPVRETCAEKTVEKICVDLSDMASKLHADIAVDTALPRLSIRPGHLDILFRQIIENALRHHHPDRRPSIHIGCDGLGAEAEFWVCDNGKGIAPEYRQKVFAMFQRLDPLGVPEGTGIGLTLCSRVVDHYGGTIRITDSPQGGCCFRFTLPLAAIKQKVP